MRSRPSGAGPTKGRRMVRRAGGGHGIPAANRVGRRRRGPRGRGAFRIRGRGRRSTTGRLTKGTRRRRGDDGSRQPGHSKRRPRSSPIVGAAARLISAVAAVLGDGAARWIGGPMSGAVGRSPTTTSSGARGRRARASRTHDNARPGGPARDGEQASPTTGGRPRRGPDRHDAGRPGTAAIGASAPAAPTPEDGPGGRRRGGARGAETTAAGGFEACLRGPGRAGSGLGRVP